MSIVFIACVITGYLASRPVIAGLRIVRGQA